ncbi:MAG: amidohydrolase [Gammaproteobacteria bacterium]|nr:amidohydrolase [Gammaproteobacteria bacterium]
MGNEVHSSHTRARGLYARIALELLKIDAWTMKNEHFRRGQTLVCAAVLALLSTHLAAQELNTFVTGQLPSLVSTYKEIHSHPELSHHEEHTSTLLAAELRKAGYAVTEHVGKYPDGSQAYGIVAVLQNGAGPKLLIRADMDALPVVEETGVPYASHVKSTNASGQEVGVMHACGHDVHVTTLIGTARALAASKGKWHGTLLLIGQPAEESIDGAKAMLADHLYERFGKPDLAIALHDTNTRAAGTVAIVSGPALASATSIDVVLRGIGGHGARPQEGKDPIVMAGEFIVQLQTIVSRRENPQDPAVVTVGDIHGGTRRNIIPNEVKMEITARAFSDNGRQIILDGIRRTAQGVAVSAGIPDNLAPIVTVLDAESTPVTYNDPKLAVRVKSALVQALGPGNVFDDEPAMVSEDFGFLGLGQHEIPTVMFWLGAMDPAKLASAQAEGKTLPGPHTSRFEPLPEPTLRTGVTAMTSVATALLQP